MGQHEAPRHQRQPGERDSGYDKIAQPDFGAAWGRGMSDVDYGSNHSGAERQKRNQDSGDARLGGRHAIPRRFLLHGRGANPVPKPEEEREQAEHGADVLKKLVKVDYAEQRESERCFEHRQVLCRPVARVRE